MTPTIPSRLAALRPRPAAESLVAGAGRPTLYRFYSLPGNFIAANFTGQ